MPVAMSSSNVSSSSTTWLNGIARRRPAVVTNRVSSNCNSAESEGPLETCPKKPALLTKAAPHQVCALLKSRVLVMFLLVLVSVLAVRFVSVSVKDGDAETKRLSVLSRLEDRINKVEMHTQLMVEREVTLMKHKLKTEVGQLVNQLEDWKDKVYDIEDVILGQAADKAKAEYNLRAYAKDLVMNEIEKHAADGLGRPDYAVNAVVVKHSETDYTPSLRSLWNKNGVHDNAHLMFTPSFGEPFQCFALKGSQGFVEFKLLDAIVVEAVTLEDLAKSVAFSRISSAPKDCRVFGWMEQDNIDDGSKSERLLAEFSYDMEKSNVQTFNVPAASSAVNMIRFEFDSNHGENYTCIYRLRVHGHQP